MNQSTLKGFFFTVAKQWNLTFVSWQNFISIPINVHKLHVNWLFLQGVASCRGLFPCYKIISSHLNDYLIQFFHILLFLFCFCWRHSTTLYSTHSSDKKSSTNIPEVNFNHFLIIWNYWLLLYGFYMDWSYNYILFVCFLVCLEYDWFVFLYHVECCVVGRM